MREILFRGKPTKDFEDFLILRKEHCHDGFVYGSLVVSGERCYICVSGMCSSRSIINNGITTMVAVIPETVGRLIEYPCYDSEHSDRKFFEGDILSVRSRWTAGDETPDIAIVIDEHSILVNGLGRKFPQDTTVVDIIGNVYDNPELVGGKYVSRYLRDFAYGYKEDA